MRLKILFLLLSCCALSYGQERICSSQDSTAVEEKMQSLAQMLAETQGDTIVAIGKTFLETPYVAKTLEIGKTESLVINLQGLDCTTFVENVMAFGLIQKNKTFTFDAFTDALLKIRYRDGVLNGYGSRLHYFTEWIRNNEKKGLVKNITAELGGQEISKPINFMTTHRNLYPFLKDDANFKVIQEAEEKLNSEVFCNLPQDQVAANERLIASGDIIALTTNINGLDVTHTGIATREADGRIHLLHASTSGEVTVTQMPLSDYLKTVKGNIGIMIVRPVY